MDLTDREKVLKIIEFEDKWLFKTGHYDDDTSIAFDAMKSKVMDIPPVQAVPIEVLYDLRDELQKEADRQSLITASDLNIAINRIDAKIRQYEGSDKE